MMPMIEGFIPRSIACTYLFLSSPFRTIMISRIVMNEGRITAVVASNAPQKPACVLPTYVARLIMMGPGVLSLTAIK